MEEKKLDENVEVKISVNDKLEFSKKARLEKEQEWYVNQMYIEHDQMFKYDKKWKQIQDASPSGIYRHIAKARKMLRDLRNTITKNDPRWNTKEVTYEWKYDKDEVDIACYFLKEVFRKNHMKLQIKDLLYHSLLKSISFMEVYIDDNNDVKMDVYDPFIIYLDRFARLDGAYIDSRRIIKACPQTISSLREKFPEQTFVPDTKQAESDKKTSLLTMDEKSMDWNPELGSTMIYEIYTKEDGKVKITTTKSCWTVIDTKFLDMEEYPILAYQPERMWGKLYPVPRIRPVIELNKSYNRVFSSMEERVHAIAKWRLAMKKWSKTSTITWENWQIVYYDWQIPTFIQPSSPWEAPFALMWQMEKHIEDTWGVHSESAGRISNSSVRSWVQVSQIQMWDILNVSEPVDNLEDFLSCIWEVILSMVSKEYKMLKKMYIWWEEVEIIGQQWAETMEKLAWSSTTKKIKPFKNIKVEIIPGTAYSDQQAKADIAELLNLWVKIDEETILEAYRFGNVREILHRMKLAQDKMQSPDVEIANWENKKMLMGQKVTANQTDDHRVHKAIHATMLQWLKDNPEIAKMIMAHIKEHELLSWWGQMQAPWMQQPPMPQPEQPMPEPNMEQNQAKI